jgi:hypothetical protein
MPQDKGAPNGPKLTPGAVLSEIPKFVINQAMSMLGVRRAPLAPPLPPRQASPGTVPQLSDPNQPVPEQFQGELNTLQRFNNRVRREPWFGPSVPQKGIAPRGDVAGRTNNYPVAYNLSLTPRQYEPVSFNMLRGLYEGLDLAKICVATRKNQMAKLSFEIMPRMEPGQNVRRKDDPRCKMLEDFLRSPDRIHSWDTWMRMLLEEMMVIDAPAIYVRRTLGGDVYALEIIDGATIIPRIDALGRTPAPPEVAYTQILHGIPAVNYTTDELIYFPRNLRAGRVYGKSEIEQILMTIQIAIRRDINKLQFWTEGNIPDALIGVPADWTPEQIDRMQQMFDAWTTDQANRRKAYFIPGGTSYNPTRPAQTLDPQQDEWLARVITYAFNLPNLPLVAQQNRATAETANDAGLREGLAPVIVWLKGLMDLIIEKYFGFSDIEWIMDDYREEDPDQLSERQLAEVRTGALSLDEYRAERGLEAIGMGPAIFGIGPLGIMFVEDLLKAQKMGLMMPQVQAPPDAGMGGAMSPYDAPAGPGGGAAGGAAGAPMLGGPGNPGAGGAGKLIAFPSPAAGGGRTIARPAMPSIANASMAQISPALLSAVGLTPDYKKVARPVGKTSKAGPPVVLDTLAHHENRFKKKA